MRTKQSAIRRLARSDDEEDAAMAETHDDQVNAQPQSKPQPQISVLSTTVNSQGQQQLEDGTVVVLPEAAETLDEGAGCFVDQAGTRCSAPGIYDTIKCTACGKKVNPYNGTMEVHPLLKVLVCNKCYKFYATGHFDADEEGKENQCRWCGEGGSLICCDNCEHSFCRTCIKRNLGRSALQDIESLPEDSVWLCYACDQGSLRQLQEEANIVMKAVRDHFKEASKRSEKQKVSLAAKKAVAAAVAHVQHQHQHQHHQQNHSPHLVQVQNHQPLLQPRPATAVPALIGVSPAIAAYGSVPRGGVTPAATATTSIGGIQLDLSSMPKVIATALPGSRIHQQPVSQQHRLSQQVQQHHHLLQHNNHQQQQQQQHQQQASVTQRTEQWYKQNVRVETILADIESVDERSIGTALNATVSLLQGMMRQYSRFMQDLTAATTQNERAQVVGRFKSAYRMHLFLRLGKLRTLIAEEDKHLMRKSAARGSLALQGAAASGQGLSNASLSYIDLTGSAPSNPTVKPSQAPPLSSSSVQAQLLKAAASIAGVTKSLATLPRTGTPTAAAGWTGRQRPTILQATSVSATPAVAAAAATSQAHPKAQRPRLPAPPPPPELVVVLSDDDDDENNNKEGNAGSGAAAAAATAKASPSAGSASPTAAAREATATANGGKPAGILELLEARRRREKCSRKTQQPRKIPGASSGDGEADGDGGGSGGFDAAAPPSDPPPASGEDQPSPLPSPASTTSGASGAKRHAHELAASYVDGNNSAGEADGGDGDNESGGPPSEKRPRREADGEELEKSLPDADTVDDSQQLQQIASHAETTAAIATAT